jgi:hypothetical protein
MEIRTPSWFIGTVTVRFVLAYTSWMTPDEPRNEDIVSVLIFDPTGSSDDALRHA